MAAYRYHRIRAEGDLTGWRTDAPYSFQIYELRLYTEANQTGTNFAATGTAIASNYYSADYSPAKINDGNEATYWSSYPVPGWVGIDSGAGNAYTCLSAAILPFVYSGHIALPKKMVFERSSDGEYWVPAGTAVYSNSDSATSVWYYYNLTEPAAVSGGFPLINGGMVR